MLLPLAGDCSNLYVNAQFIIPSTIPLAAMIALAVIGLTHMIEFEIDCAGLSSYKMLILPPNSAQKHFLAALLTVSVVMLSGIGNAQFNVQQVPIRKNKKTIEAVLRWLLMIMLIYVITIYVYLYMCISLSLSLSLSLLSLSLISLSLSLLSNIYIYILYIYIYIYISLYYIYYI